MASLSTHSLLRAVWRDALNRGENPAPLNEILEMYEDHETNDSTHGLEWAEEAMRRVKNKVE